MKASQVRRNAMEDAAVGARVALVLTVLLVAIGGLYFAALYLLTR
jgi:hypothetical protein